MAIDLGEKSRGYRLLELRSKTRVALVYDAEGKNGEAMVLKVLLGAEDASTRQEIKSIQMLAKLAHPNILTVDEVWSHGKSFIVAMKRADGSLQDYYEAYQSEYGRGIDAPDLCGLLRQAALALDFLNMQKHHLGSWPAGIQHCDVKPSNLLMFGETIKLSDFGLATQVSLGARPQLAGAAEYVAPEIVQGRLSPFSDQYSLAVTYCYLRSGRFPFSDALQAGRSFHSRPQPDLALLGPREKPIVTRALAAIPQQRWPSCSDLIRELAEAANSKSSPADR